MINMAKKLKEEEISIILKRDGTMESIPRNKLRGKIKRLLIDLDAEYLLIPVGMHTPSYAIIKVEDCIKYFGKMNMEYSLCVMGDAIITRDAIEGTGKFLYNAKTAPSVNLEITNYADFISVIYSIIRLQAFNYVYNSLSRTFVQGLKEKFIMLNNMKVTYDNGESILSAETGMTPIKREVLVRLLYDIMGEKIGTLTNQFLGAVLTSKGVKERLIIDFKKCRWFMGKRKDITSDSMLISVPMTVFGSIVFISNDDYEMVSEFQSGSVSIAGLECKGGIKSYTFDDFVYASGLDCQLTLDFMLARPEFFFVPEKSTVALYTQSDIIEYAAELPYFLMVYQMLINITGEDEFEGLMVEMCLFLNIDSIDITKRKHLEPFYYSLNNFFENECESDDTLSHFLEMMRLYLKDVDH